jgi:integrase
MKYTKKIKLKSGKEVIRFDPPRDVKLAGVVKSQSFHDGRAARYEIPRLIEKVEAYRRGEILEGDIGPKSKLKHVVNHYLNSKQFGALSAKSQVSYETELNSILRTEVHGIPVGEIRLNSLDARVCAKIYEEWVDAVSVATANTKSRILSVVLNYCCSLDLLVSNPMSKVKKLKHQPKSIIWTQDQVEKFLDTAFSRFEWRNIGLIVMMCYEWAQRPVDIRNLKWSNLDLSSGRVQITQSKRGATVELPVEENLRNMLKAQEKDWGFQEYVVPHHRPSDNAYRPMSGPVMVSLIDDVKQEAGLPDDLQAGHLRKTAINEFLEAGVDTAQIMSVSGHKNISSLNPYVKHRYSTANTAMQQRKKVR